MTDTKDNKKTEKKEEPQKPREQFTAYQGRVPYQNCTWWDTITFGWCKPFIDQTQDEKNYVKQSEFGAADPAYAIQPAYEKLNKEWLKQQAANPESKYKLFKASMIAFKNDMMINVVASLIGTFRGIIKPLIFERMITNVVNNGDKMYSIQLAALLLVIQISFSMIMDQHYSMHLHQKGDLMREAMKSMVFEKQLKVTSSSNKKYNNAKVNDLIHNRSNKLPEIFHRAPRFVCLPVNFLFSTFYLYYHMGYSFIGGFVLFSISIYMNYKIDNQRREMWKGCHRNYEKRITLVEELIENIKTLKLNSWTNIWRDQVREARLYEHDQWYKMNLKNKAIDLITGNVSNALRIVVYTTFFASGNTIGLGEALAVESTLGMFEGSIREIPGLLDFKQNITESFEKLQDYFEVPEANVSFIERIQPQLPENENAVKIVDGNFHWGMTLKSDELEEDKKARLEREAEKEKEKKEKKEKKQKKKATKGDDKEVTTVSASETTAAESDDSNSTNESKKKEKKEQTLLDFTTLKGVNVTIKKGEFVTIIGDVASGKSSFLHALVGDMLSLDQQFVDDLGEKVLDEDLKKQVKAHSLQQSSNKQIEINGSISYTHQTPWILNKTVRENILFGAPMDEERYNQTINTCQMARDLENMDDSDQTEIGERGINLSGGQKARVGLARAVYANKDIILMDDPVSALDAQVKKSIFKQVIMGVLKDKTRILATHAIDFLDVCDSIICLDKGNVVFQGHYNEVKDNEYMKKLMDIHQSHKKLQEEAAKKAAEKKAKIEAEQALFGDKEEEKTEEVLKKEASIKEEKKEEEKTKPFKVDLKKQFNLAKKLIRDDEEDEDKVTRGFWDIFKDYLSYSGGYTALAVYFVILAIQAIIPIFNTMQFGEWVLAKDSYENAWYYSLRYAAFSIGSMLLGMSWGIATDYFNYDSQMDLFKDILKSICAAPINLYFDITPTGRVYERVNHASGHINWLPHMMGHGFRTFAAMVTTVCLAFYEVPKIFILIIPGIYMIRKAQTSVGISQHRLGHIRHHLSMPSWTHQSETQHGISTIRAYNQLDKQMGVNFGLKQDTLAITVFCHGLHRYKELRILIISQVMVFAITCACILENTGLATAALLLPMLISRCEGLTHQIGGFMWFFNDFEDHMKYMEKSFMVRNIKSEVFEGTVKKEELDKSIEEENTSWPAKGGIEFKDVELRYRPEKDLVLKKLSFNIKAGEKVGVIGRTGAGKSTLCLALSRIVEIDSGSISIDGQNTKDMDLDHLRSCITVIPQDPVLFSGTLKKNLDPLKEFDDEKLESVLRRAKMGHLIDNNEEGLETEMKEIGELSSGEKQIICICRAILKKNRIVVLDEATANIDVVTEQKIQELIKGEFADSTMITVAHRLNTIIQSDKILVLGHGKTIEMGSPDELISQADSTFNKYLLDLKNGDADDFM